MTAIKAQVWCISGLDPSGGAGLQADIESVGAAGARAAVICTALTVQNTQSVDHFVATDVDLVNRQGLKLLDEQAPAVIKSGMLGSIELVNWLSDWVAEYPTDLVLDPVLVANSGGSLSQEGASSDQINAAYRPLIAQSLIVTPNLPELKQLTGTTDSDRGAEALLNLGAKYVLVKGGHQVESGATQSSMIINTLYHADQPPVRFYLPRLPAEFHGSGCSMASFFAGRLALGQSMNQAFIETHIWLNHVLLSGFRQARASSTDRSGEQVSPDRYAL